MTTPILTTKLYVPPSHPKLVSRTHLIEQLNSGLSCRLTLISAPAGFGKSTLLSAWVQQIEADVRVAWLSLDEGDNDLTRFLTYFIAALQTIETDIGQGALAALQSSGLVNTEGLLTSLLNEIANFPGNAVLILDDYHVIESQPIDQAITFLLDHLPPQMHLIVASRIDPSWPLSRLRVRGQITEIRADDLRFAIEEAIEFLNQVMGLKLSTQDVTSLEGRTEGWIAGLHLAALSIQGLKHRGMIADFVNRFTGSDRYIQDYLADEVLQQQSDQVKDFLLHTSILNRLTAPLCNSVTKMENSQIILEKLENANLFIVPLDNERRWYRYHHLFADLLNHRLRQIFPDQISDLHQRASEWYEQHDFPSDAIRHAFSAKNLERAAALAELAWPAWNGSFQSIEWLSWLKALPAELVRSRPVLCVAYAWAFLNSGDLEAAETRLLDAEHWLEPTVNISERPDTRMVVVDDEQFQSLPVSLATARAYHAQATGDVARTVKYAKRVLDLSPDGDSQYRGDATALLGLAHWTSGDIEAAHQTLSDGLAVMKPLDVIIGTFVLAEMKMTLGHLHEAIRTCEHALRLAADHGEPMPIGTEDVYSGISELHRERGDLESATQDLTKCKELGEQIELPDWQYRYCIAQARLNETLGDLDDALRLLDEAERVFVRTPLPVVRPIAAMKARIWVRQGRLSEAQSWVRERELSADDDLSYLREFEHITLTRCLIARYQVDRTDASIDDAIRLLERLLLAAEAGKRMGSMIEILALQSLANQAQGNVDLAHKSLEHALKLAEPEGYCRIFVDEGQPMAKLLYEAARKGIQSDYSRKVLTVFKSEKATGHSQQHQNLVEPLSDREIEVLQLIAQGLSNREISERLYLALDTIKGHNRRIYSKLGVKKRIDAVERARELGLL